MDAVGAPAVRLTAPAAPPRGRVGRDGELRLSFERRGGRTVLAAARSTLPLQVLAPVALADAASVVSVLNPTGGLVGGDRLTIEVSVGPGAHAVLTTPSATKVYRTAGPIAEQTVRLRLGPAATLEWVPDHTIPFPGSAFRQTIEAELTEDARLVLVDAFAAGRVARGEAWQFAHLESMVDVRGVQGRLLLDRFVLGDGGPGAAGRYRALGVAEDHPYFATIVVVAAGELTAYARAVTRGEPEVAVGAAPLVRAGAVVRILARTAPALLGAVDGVWTEARRHLLGLPRLDLRK